MSYFSDRELRELGFASIGENVCLSRKASIFGGERISLGAHSRIDDFCVLSAGEGGGIAIGQHVHIGVFCSVIGSALISLCDFSGLSSRVTIYSSSDDYSGAAMTNPTVPIEFTNVEHRAVKIGRHAIIGSGSVILPGAEVGDGVAVGALSLVKGHLAPYRIFAGVPAKPIGERERGFLTLEAKLSGNA